MRPDNGTQPRTWTLSIFAGVTSVSLISLLAYMQWREAKAVRSLRTTIEISNAKQRLISSHLALLQDNETGQRGYLVTGNPDFRGPFDAAMRRLPRSECAIQVAYSANDPARDEAAQFLTTGHQRANCAQASALPASARRSGSSN